MSTGLLNEFLAYGGLFRIGKGMPYIASSREEMSDFARANHDLYIIDPGYSYSKRGFSIRSSRRGTSGRRSAPPISTLFVGKGINEAMRFWPRKSQDTIAKYERGSQEYKMALQKSMVELMFGKINRDEVFQDDNFVLRVFSTSLLRQAHMITDDA